ncbi:hypothetical protein IAQ61_008954 [Plenodomus lingam]|uniref:uncharacterized protein n=1 Tax=Leptosphaeria maculans TaxID=5022 RepID=UPI00332FA4FB|nr:hypothetical protein IAQ61_008954 [Plenodomus lingam]
MIAVDGFDELVTVDEGCSVVANASLAMLLTSRNGEEAEFRLRRDSECEGVYLCSFQEARYVQFAVAVVDVDGWRRRVVDCNSAKRGQDSRLGAPAAFRNHVIISMSVFGAS